MSVGHPWALLIALLPLLWTIYSWRSALNRTALLLKGFSLLLIAVAFSQPAITIPETKTGVVVLLDLPRNSADDELNRAASLVTEIHRHRRSNWMQVVPVAEETRRLNSKDISRELHLLRASNEGNANLEAALTASAALIPEGYVPRIVLVGDGENEGSVARAVPELQSLDVPVDTIPLSEDSKQIMYLAGSSVPSEAYAGEQLPIDLTIYSPRSASAAVKIAAEGKSLGESRIELREGLNKIRIHARVGTSGATFLSGSVRAPGLGEIRFENAISLRPAKVLYISEDPPGSDNNLLAAFKEADYRVARATPSMNQDLKSFQLIVLNNLNLKDIAPANKQRLADYVGDGGGLLLITGEREMYKEDAQMDVLDRILPAKMAPPKKPEGICIALVLDKSSSMEGKKIALARLSAIGVVDHLKPTDTIGVLMFDNSFQWAVPLRRAEDKPFIKRLIAGIVPDGGTQIAPALEEAYHRVLASGAVYKHIVLMTDGISEEGNSMDLAKDAEKHEITISTVGLGQDVNRSYLERVAAASGGKSYFLDKPQGLEQILLKDVVDYSGSTAIEKALTPIVQNQSEVLDGIDMASAPALKGYVRFETKPTAQTVLSIDKNRKDPLYVHWQYGLGQVAVFTSDAKSRWAAPWIGWPGFDKFWTNVSHTLLSHTDQTESRVDYDAADGKLLITYRLGEQVTLPDGPPQIFVLGPQGFRHAVDLAETAPHVYKGSVPIGKLTGAFRMRPLKDSPAFPEIGYFRPSEEGRAQLSNDTVLRRLSGSTGGQFNPNPASVFRSNGKSMVRVWQLWPSLLALAIMLNIAELCIRKQSALKAMLHFRQ